jgi:hypothetical protein
MNYSVWRSAVDGKYRVHEGSDGTGPAVFTHSSENVAHAHMDTLQAPAPVLADLPPDPNAMLNEVIAHIANTWGRYEQPAFGLDQVVRHKPTGVVCLVRGFIAWEMPIVLYHLEAINGAANPQGLTAASDIEVYKA